MKNFFDEHRLLIVVGLLIVAFFGVALSQPGSSTDETANKVDKFRDVDVESPMYKGSTEATASIIQYSDFLCPSCSLFSTQVMPTVDEKYIETDKANFEFRPMAFIADGSLQAGLGGYCAVDQEKFWPYHDNIYGYVANEVFNNQKDPKSDMILNAAIVKQIAKATGLDSEKFDTCLDSQEHLDTLNESNATANQNGVTGTPYIMVNGQVYQGNITLSAFEPLLKASL